MMIMKMIKNSEHDNDDNDADHNKNRLSDPSLLYNSMVLVIKTIIIREYDSGIRGWQSRRATPPTVMIQITGMTVMQFPPFCQRPLRSKPPSCSPYPPSPPPLRAWQVGQQVSEGSSNDIPPLPCGWRWRLAPLSLDSEGSWAMKSEVDLGNTEIESWKRGREELPWMGADGCGWRDDDGNGVAAVFVLQA